MNMREINTLENTSRWRKTVRGLVTNLYQKMKARQPISITLSELHEFASSSIKFRRLYEEWCKSGFNKERKPSIDRISNKRGYDKDNMQWLTWSENRYKQNMERRSRKGPVIQLIDGVVVKRFSSQREAAKKTGLSQGNLSSVLNGKRDTVGGYKFIYENPELLNL